MPELNVVGNKVLSSESNTLEFKSCRNGLSKDFWPTYSAFANTFGGTVYIGIDDGTREIIGVANPDKLLKELWDLVNDTRKVSVNLLSPNDVSIEEINGCFLIKVNVPRAEHEKRPVFINGSMENGTYKRNGEGDYHCSIEELKQMLRDSATNSPDSTVLSDMILEDLDSQSIKSFRERMSKRNPMHPWNDKDDCDFLRIIGACSRSSDGALNPTAAGLLMFGYDYSIMSVFPNYHLDYLEFPDNSDNWTFRISTGTGAFAGNIYTFVSEVFGRLMIINDRRKETAAGIRIDDTPVMRAQRELLVNALSHADYFGLRGIRAEWRSDCFSVRNPGNLRIPLREMLNGGISDPRNPRISIMLGLIGLSERAGSGVNDVVTTCRNLRLPNPEYTETSNPETVSVKLRFNPQNNRNDAERAVLDMIRDNPSVSIVRLSNLTGIERNRVSRIIDSLKDKGIVQRVGGTRGYWKLTE